MLCPAVGLEEHHTLASHSIPATEMPSRMMTVMVPMIRISLISSVMRASTFYETVQGDVRWTVKNIYS